MSFPQQPSVTSQCGTNSLLLQFICLRHSGKSNTDCFDEKMLTQIYTGTRHIDKIRVMWSYLLLVSASRKNSDLRQSTNENQLSLLKTIDISLQQDCNLQLEPSTTADFTVGFNSITGLYDISYRSCRVLPLHSSQQSPFLETLYRFHCLAAENLATIPFIYACPCSLVERGQYLHLTLLYRWRRYFNGFWDW